MITRLIFVSKIEHDDKYDQGKRAGEFVRGLTGDPCIICCPNTECGQESLISFESITIIGSRVSMKHYTECPHCKTGYTINKNKIIESPKETSKSTGV